MKNKTANGFEHININAKVSKPNYMKVINLTLLAVIIVLILIIAWFTSKRGDMVWALTHEKQVNLAEVSYKAASIQGDTIWETALGGVNIQK